MRLWVLAHEFAGHALFAATHVRDALSDLVRQHVGGFRPDPNAVADRLGSLDTEAGDPMAALQQALGDPEVLLGAVTSPEQQALRPRLDALVAVVVGYTDWVVDAVAVRVVGGNALRIAEAVRRRRVETTSSDSFVEQLLGIRLGDDQVARGKAFVQGVVDRAGDAGMAPAAAPPRRHPDPERGRRARPLAGPHRAPDREGLLAGGSGGTRSVGSKHSDQGRGGGRGRRRRAATGAAPRRRRIEASGRRRCS